ncbi:histone deacetylase family protein [Burkholderia guangdongensis]|uniref:histone deacetylase family protein n=1 Tax=Burkholderia guangdongensis TaxID=1792500 RepID=UPI0015C8D04F|nr:histone deacetylase family protein [Burkholderia guangdongensis]
MITIYGERHRLHHGKGELIDGELKPCFEMPRRVDIIHERLKHVGLGAVVAPDAFGIESLARAHSDAYLEFLQNAWNEWSAMGRTHDGLPTVWPARGMRTDRPPKDIDGKLGYYSMDAGAPITAGTWAAIEESAWVALTGARLVEHDQRAAFALCRPPGHHAGRDVMGGYCYLNNAAIAAEDWLARGAKRVAILDVDYHHGNGTQSIFYERGDVLFASLHADPAVDYPHFLGYADETGHGAGADCNHNYPMPWGTDWSGYSAALADACGEIGRFAPDALIVSLGVDTFEGDPISSFKLKSDDYPRMGAAIARLGLPTLFVMEGGYAVDEIGVNAVGVLTGFESAA